MCFIIVKVSWNIILILPCRSSSVGFLLDVGVDNVEGIYNKIHFNVEFPSYGTSAIRLFHMSFW